MIKNEQNRRKRASHGMASFFSLVKIDEIMRAPYEGVFVEELIRKNRSVKPVLMRFS